MKLFKKDRWMLLSFLFTITVTSILVIYNATIGILFHVFFNLFSSFYYLILLTVRITIFVEEYQWMKKGIPFKKSGYVFTSVFMIYLTGTIALTASILAYFQTSVNITNTSSIVIAALAFVKLLSLSKRCVEFRKDRNLFNRQILNVTLISTGVTLLTLMNTAFVANGGFNSVKSAVFLSSGILLVYFMEAVTIISFLKGLKTYKEMNQKTNP